MSLVVTDGCSLLETTFGWWLQLVLLGTCFGTLIAKRFLDEVRRPWRIWFYDTSKQATAALLVHVLNLGSAMVFGWIFQGGKSCNWYWISLVFDSTLGCVVQLLLLNLSQRVYRCAGRPELAKTGYYGDPPDSKIFCRQLFDWIAIVLVQKAIMVVLLIRSSGTLSAAANFLLGWLSDWPRVKLVFVMVISPILLNVAVLWVMDSFLQAATALSAGQVGEEGVSPHQHVGGPSPAPNANLAGSSDVTPIGFSAWKTQKGF